MLEREQTTQSTAAPSSPPADLVRVERIVERVVIAVVLALLVGMCIGLGVAHLVVAGGFQTTPGRQEMGGPTPQRLRDGFDDSGRKPRLPPLLAASLARIGPFCSGIRASAARLSRRRRRLTPVNQRRRIAPRSEGQRRLLEHALGMRAIATRLDVSKQAVGQWRAGKTTPGSELRRAIERHLGIPALAWDFMPGTKPGPLTYREVRR